MNGTAANLGFERELWLGFEFVQQAVAQILWGHNVRILDKISDPAERQWWVRQTIEQWRSDA